MQRYGQVLGIKTENIAEYTRLHAAVWPGVLKMIHECNIRNYSIFQRTTSFLPTLSTSATILTPTWPKWPPTQRHKNGGQSARRYRIRCRQR
ncbi:MAG: L-rhamnose mutarotase [Caldilineaceae bacterium]